MSETSPTEIGSAAGLFARVARRRRRLACLVVVAAAAGSRDREDERYEQQHRPRQPSHHLHGTSLVAIESSRRMLPPSATRLLGRTVGMRLGGNPLALGEHAS